MAKLTITYLPKSVVNRALEFEGNTFSYNLIPNGFSFEGDAPTFEHQALEHYVMANHNIISLIEEISFADESELPRLIDRLNQLEWNWR